METRNDMIICLGSSKLSSSPSPPSSSSLSLPSSVHRNKNALKQPWQKSSRFFVPMQRLQNNLASCQLLKICATEFCISRRRRRCCGCCRRRCSRCCWCRRCQRCHHRCRCWWCHNSYRGSFVTVIAVILVAAAVANSITVVIEAAVIGFAISVAVSNS